MRRAVAIMLAATCASGLRAQAAPSADAVIVTEFTNPGLTPSHWTLTLHPDGSGHFHSEGGDPRAEAKETSIPSVDRDIHVSAEFAGRVYQVAQQHHWFNENCESNLKVAFQGWKKISYEGPGGRGSCTFNYSKDHDVQFLGDELTGVAETVLEGARLEMLLQHDPLGLDRETEFIMEATKDGRLLQICVIKGVLEQLEADPGVLDRVRKRARTLLARADR
jgi:hypothetical protein